MVVHYAWRRGFVKGLAGGQEKIEKVILLFPNSDRSRRRRLMGQLSISNGFIGKPALIQSLRSSRNYSVREYHPWNS
jgi:hypothetical protein